MTDTEEREPRSAPPAPDLRLRPDPPRVMRLSRKALAALGLGGGITLGAALLYGLQSGHKTAPAELLSTGSRTTADTVAAAPKDYGQTPKLGPPLPGDLGRPIVSARQRGVEVQPPAMGASPQRGSSPAANAASAARQRAAQERDAARTSKLFQGGGAATTVGSAPSGSEPTAVASAKAGTGETGAATPAPSEDAIQNGQASKRAFLKGDADRRTETTDRLAAPASPYVVQAGSVIAAALITGIRSDLPGQITAQVTENVYDSPTGRFLLIPQGAKLIGEYDSQVSFGQNRVLLAWDRLILPSGQSITLDRQPGADPAGFAGLQDGINNHWSGMAKAAVLSTLLAVGAEAGSSNDDDLVRALRRGTSDTINQSGQQLVRRQLNVQPTLTVRPGYPVRVIVTRDLILAPIQIGAH
jgi:type IV secretion system protein VirB10